MAMRLTGLMSGMDTDSIIQELVAARKTKVDTQKKAQTKLSWQQDLWKGLNTKLKSFMSKVSNLRFTSSFIKKTTSVSNSSIASVITGENAVDSTQSLEVRKLAKSAYLTGGKISAKDGGSLTALSKMSDLGFEGEGSFTIKTGSAAVDINVNENTTISDVLTQLKSAGVNASFDANQQRFYISAKTTGAAADFSLTATDQGGMKALKALGLQTKIGTAEEGGDEASLRAYEAAAKGYVKDNWDETISNLSGQINSTISSRENSYLNKYQELQSSKKTADDKIAAILANYTDGELKSVDEYDEDLKTVNAEKAELEKQLADAPEEEREALQSQLDELNHRIDKLTEDKSAAETVAKQEQAKKDYDAQIEELKNYVTITETPGEDGTVTYSATATEKLTQEVQQSYYDKAEYAASVVEQYNNGAFKKDDSFATKINGQDAEIILNGALYENSTNTFEINGLTITAQQVGEATLTTQNDTDGIYDMIKDLFKEYNSIINELDKLYNADSAKGYEPLTSEEKETMSESEIEEWEKKIKDALLRNDDNLSNITSALTSVMAGGIQVNGKTMYLFNFGIENMNYMLAADNEKHAYHIDGDPDDTNTSGNADKLKSMIASDPNTVVTFFVELSRNLYSKMDELSKSVKDYRSYGSFYDDKKMQSDYDSYTSKIKSLEDKLNEYEDKWYKKFSAMESAMAKMQSSVNAVTALLGG